MWKRARKILIAALSALILTIGGCLGYVKTDYAPDASFVMQAAK